jgi:hypothetical protein
MIQKEITIQGKTYPVVFTMKTIVNFEEIANKSFFGEQLEKLSDRMAIVIAAVLAADEHADMKVSDMTSLDWDGIQELLKAFSVVMEMSLEFFKIPGVIDKPEKKGEGKSSKNA